LFLVVVVLFLFLHQTTKAMGILRFAGAFAVVKRQSELKISEANAEAKSAKCTSASQWT